MKPVVLSVVVVKAKGKSVGERRKSHSYTSKLVYLSEAPPPQVGASLKEKPL